MSIAIIFFFVSVWLYDDDKGNHYARRLYFAGVRPNSFLKAVIKLLLLLYPVAIATVLIE